MFEWINMESSLLSLTTLVEVMEPLENVLILPLSKPNISNKLLKLDIVIFDSNVYPAHVKEYFPLSPDD
jgi:hypothetical protein